MPPIDTVAAARGQRRYVTMLFADLSGSSALARRLEAEDFAELLDRFRGVCREVLTRHQGFVARLQGDGLLAVFGYPQAAEDAPWHAIHAALELRDAVGRIDLADLPGLLEPLQVHCGVHAGMTLIHEGDVELGRIDLVGDLPNSAARLSARAAAGEVLVSRDALGPFQAHFQVGPERDVALDSTGALLAASPVLAQAAPQRQFDARVRRGLARFVGRQAPLQALLNFALAPAPARPALATLSGGPGLGKSRLLEELQSCLAETPLTVARGYCEGYLGSEVLQPFMQLARALRLAQTPATSATALDTTLVMGIIEEAARHGALLLVLDDWHWADDASVQMLRTLVAQPLPLRVLLASRDEDVRLWARGDAPELALEPLSLDDTMLTARDLLPQADPLLVQELHRLAGGVPLFVEELCHATGSAAGLGPARDALQGTAWLNLLTESRLLRLPDELVEFISLCAVIGNVVPGQVLEGVLPAERIASLTQAAEQADFLLRRPGPPQWSFKHGLTRDAVYGRIGLLQRRRIHRQVFDAFASGMAPGGGEDTTEALARHSAGAGLADAAAEYAERAGDRALAANAFDVARRHFAQAVGFYENQANPGPDTWQRWSRAAGKLGMACVFDPLALADGVGLFERALQAALQLGQPQGVARARYWLGYICYAKGQVRQALHHGGAAVALAEELDDRRLGAQARATLGQTLVAAGRYAQALPLLEGALDSKRASARPGSGVAVGSAYSLACVGCLLGDQGRFDEAHDRFKEALTLLGDSGHPVASSVRGWVSAVHLWQGRWTEALVMAEEGERIAEQARVRQLLAMSRALSGYARWRMGAGASARQQVLEATGWIQQRQGGFFTSLNHGWLVEMAAAEGDTAAARGHAAWLFTRARQGDCLGLAMGARALASLAQRQGQLAQAQHYLAVAQRAAKARNSAHEAALNLACEAALHAANGARWAQPSAAG